LRECCLLMSTKTDISTAIAFSTPMLTEINNAREIHVDATYKTAKGHFELYAIVGQFQGSGFALSYLISDICQDNELTRMTVLTEFFTHFRNLGLNPDLFLPIRISLKLMLLNQYGMR